MALIVVDTLLWGDIFCHIQFTSNYPNMIFILLVQESLSESISSSLICTTFNWRLVDLNSATSDFWPHKLYSPHSKTLCLSDQCLYVSPRWIQPKWNNYTASYEGASKHICLDNKSAHSAITSAAGEAPLISLLWVHHAPLWPPDKEHNTQSHTITCTLTPRFST